MPGFLCSLDLKTDTKELPCSFKSDPPARTCPTVIPPKSDWMYQPPRTRDENVHIFESKVHRIDTVMDKLNDAIRPSIGVSIIMTKRRWQA